jgi:hypothetical protein
MAECDAKAVVGQSHGIGGLQRALERALLRVQHHARALHHGGRGLGGETEHLDEGLPLHAQLLATDGGSLLVAGGLHKPRVRLAGGERYGSAARLQRRYCAVKAHVDHVCDSGEINTLDAAPQQPHAEQGDVPELHYQEFASS